MDTQYVTAREARDVTEQIARSSYGRLVALLASSTGDVALAEDALSAAFEQALTTWPGGGVPRNPEGWMLTVARNRQRDTWKSAFTRTSVPLEAGSDQGPKAMRALDDLDFDAVGDKRLELLFVCAHPGIDPGVSTPLMLQTVLGIDAARIAAAFAVPAQAMAQRLVRAKKRIKETRIPFVVPDRQAMPGRLPAVLEAIYGCYAIAWSDHEYTDMSGPVTPREDLSGEAQYLALTLARLLRTEPEPWGLAALITLSLARVPGRSKSFVPLEEQDTASWDARLIAEGEAYLHRASALGCSGSLQPGRFQIEAAIQAVHCARARTHRTDWPALQTLYTALVAVAPSLGARVALAAVVGRSDAPSAGLEMLDAIDAGPTAARAAINHFQPFHAVRAELLARAGRTVEAAAAFRDAAALARQPAVRTYLTGRAED